MKLPLLSLPFGKKKSETKYFLSLLLRDEQVSAFILQENNGQLQIVGKNEKILPTSIEQSTTEQWIEVLDRIISKAEETLPTNIMTHQTMFGVKENWVEEEKIKKDYLSKLKKVCESLELQPIGFLVISEAIAHRLQEQEGAPLTAILVEIGRTQVTVSHIRAGKTVETRHSIIVDSAANTVDALLKHFTSATVLPSRIVLFDGAQMETIAQDFIAHQWSKSLPFLHMPQITPLQHGFDATAVILGAAEQMGLRVSSEISHASTLNETQAVTEPLTKGTKQTAAQQFSQQYTQPKQTLDQENKEEEQIQTVNSDSISADNFGFVQETDVADTQPVVSHTSTQNQTSMNGITSEQTETSEETEANKQSGFAPLQGIKFYLMDIFEKIFFRSEKATKAGGFIGIPKALFILPVILLLIAGAIVWYISQVQATVNLTLKPKIVEEKGDITFSLTGANDFSQNTLAAQDQTVDLQGSSTTDATGKKDVGTPAKGTVTLYNSSNSSAQLSAGTTLTSVNNHTFTLDKDVTVASASGDIFSGTKPGTTDTTVTAKDIGTEANLPSGVTFNVSGTSSIAAKNSSAFSGGTKKQVTVVSQKDLDKLANDLPNSLSDQAKQQLQQKVNGDQVLLPNITDVSLSNKSYSKKLNDQASSVSLKATATFHQASYNKNDLQDLGKLLLKDKFTDNQSLSDKGIMSDVSDIKTNKDKSISASIDLKAGLLPKLDKNNLLQEITGKSVDQAKNFLSNQPQVETSNIHLSPNIPPHPATSTQIFQSHSDSNPD